MHAPNLRKHGDTHSQGPRSTAAQQHRSRSPTPGHRIEERHLHTRGVVVVATQVIRYAHRTFDDAVTRQQARKLHEHGVGLGGLGIGTQHTRRVCVYKVKS